MTTARSSEPQAAATVVLLRPGPDGPEVLLTRRPSSMAFAADMYVFPGGRVDPGDGDAELAARSARSAAEAAGALGGNLPADAALALHHAAIRELFEEAGVLLADGAPEGAAAARPTRDPGAGFANATAAIIAGGGRLRTDLLAPIAHWTTPRFMARRFSTWFFVADLPPGVEPTFISDEVTEHRWLTPAAALEQMAAGAIEMWVPTTSVLERLIEIGAARAADVARELSFGPAAAPAIVEDGPALVQVRFAGAGAVPGRPGTATLHGRRDLIVVDPGDPSEAALDAMEAVASGRGAAIRAIVLTAPDPDHAAGAEALAIPLEVPILVAPGAGRSLPYATREVVDGERLPADVDVRVHLGAAGSGRLEVLAGSAGE